MNSKKTQTLVNQRGPAPEKPAPGGAVKEFLKALGPGLITGASDDDPSGIVTCLDAGQVGWGGARQEITDVRQAEARQAGEKIEDEGDAHEKIVAFLEQLKVI